MKKIIICLALALSVQSFAKTFDVDFGTGKDNSSINDCTDFSNFDLDGGDINDYLDYIKNASDAIARGIETHANEGVLFKMSDMGKANFAESAMTIEQNTKIIVELEKVTQRDTIKRLQTYIGLNLMRDSIGDYKNYNHSKNFKVCFSAKEFSKFESMEANVMTIVKVQGAVTVAASCPVDEATEINNQDGETVSP